jgi:hypothetical protein
MFSRQPLTAMLGTTAEAANALKQNNLEQYAQKLKEWQNHRDAVIQIEKGYATALSSAYKGAGQSAQAQHAVVSSVMNAYGQNRADIAQAETARYHTMRLHSEAVKAAEASVAKDVDHATKVMHDAMGTEAFKHAPPDIQAAMAERALAIRQEALLVDSTDPQAVAAARKKAFTSATEFISDLGKAAATGNWQSLAASGKGGATAADRQQRMVLALGNVTKASEALTILGEGANTGILPYLKTKGGLTDYFTTKTFGRMSDQKNRMMQSIFAGITRNIAALETGGAATGLVELSKKLEEALVINVTDDKFTTANKIATIREDTEQAIQTSLSSGRLTKEQAETAKALLARLEQAIPFNREDVIRAANAAETRKTGKPIVSLRESGQNIAQQGRQGPPEQQAGARKISPEERFKQLIERGMSEDEVYAQMRKEGYK